MGVQIATGAHNSHAGVAAIVARVPVDAASRAMADAFRSEVAALQRLSGASQDDILTGVRRNLRRWWRWLATGIAPRDEDFDPLREWGSCAGDRRVLIDWDTGGLAVPERDLWWPTGRPGRRTSARPTPSRPGPASPGYVARLTT